MVPAKKIVLFMAAALALTAAGCTRAPRTLVGVSLSPKSFAAADFTAFFPLAKQAGNTVSWAGQWKELENEKGAPYVVNALAKKEGLVPVPIIGMNGSLATQATSDEMEQALVRFATETKPPYLAVGVEENKTMSFPSPAFTLYAQRFGEWAKALKAVSPHTRVFPVFQYEWLVGQQDGLFGGTNDATKNQWDALALFPDADLVGFTTYPGLVFHNPEDIPDGYYAAIREHTDKPIAFVETGWHVQSTNQEWDSDEAEQARFVSRFFSLTASLQPVIRIWSFVYDPPVDQVFRSMGLRRSDGSARPSWAAWTGAAKQAR